MRINLDWLHEYVDFDASIDELANRLTMTSLESILLIEKSDFFETVTVGQVTHVDPHPDADKLQVCQVKVSADESRQILCGAPNVAPDQRVPVIHPGTTLPDGNTIGSMTLRGVDSHGMIASERELGLSDSHAGIMVLRDDATVGQPFWKYLEQYWSGLDIEITPNRPDCMSHLGIAREVGAIYKTDLRRPEIAIKESTESIDSIAKIRIHEPEKCPRYAARIIRNVSIEPSPLWLQQRLAAVGLRPINNVVDISNYVLMETGHPLHTFDLDEVAEHTIEVRSAREGELFTTLDGKERELSEDVLLICDANSPVAVAG
ncbi:MAG TPA: phenylalanine--tRNA ligase subunit beta, partial [bacterium]|nr:phenylalanine--tRNA ligase subunit beta [bacterium]